MILLLLPKKTSYSSNVEGFTNYRLMQVNRKELSMTFRLMINGLIFIHILIKEKPDVIMTTGVLGKIPICLLAKFRGKKLIYIELFAKSIHKR